ncbi:protein tincar-like [Lytechinus pictus]|uniref:protein tincar-like n=1 Tax=Lytechinus pictus TaxID=7653 RepID=UPI0030B9F60E
MSCNLSSMRMNSLESIWYCNLAVVITMFLVFDGNRRYRHYDSLKWPEGERPTPELRLYLCLIIMAALLITAFIPTQYFKVGNHANDQSKLGAAKRKRKKKKPDETKTPKDCQQGDARGDEESIAHIIRVAVQTVRSCRKHLGPIGATIHITSAFCLLLPVIFLQARAIQSGLLPPEMIWKSEVGEIFLVEDSTNITYLRMHAFVAPSIEYQSILPTESTPSAEHQSDPVSTLDDSFSTVVVTINYLNYVVPLFIYAIRYADVFWECHKGFALLISIQLMMNAVQYALGFIGMSLLYKLHGFGWEKYNIGAKPVFSSGPSLIPAYLINNITVFVAAAILYLYGFGRLKHNQLRRTRNSDDVPIETLFVLKYNGFLPQIAAMGALVVFISCKTPFILEYMSVYRLSGDQRMLCCVVFDSLYIVVWFVLWVFLTIKRHWAFRHVHHIHDYGLYDRGIPLQLTEGVEPFPRQDKSLTETQLTGTAKPSDPEECQCKKKKSTFPNGYLQMKYTQNGELVDKYTKVSDVETPVDEVHLPPVDRPTVVDPNVPDETDVNIFSNPLSTA